MVTSITIGNSMYTFKNRFYLKAAKWLQIIYFTFSACKKLCIDYRQVPHVRGNHVAVSSLIPKIATIQNDRHSTWFNFPKYLCLLVELIRLSTEHFFNLYKISEHKYNTAKKPKGSCRTPPPPVILDGEYSVLYDCVDCRLKITFTINSGNVKRVSVNWWLQKSSSQLETYPYLNTTMYVSFTRHVTLVSKSRFVSQTKLWQWNSWRWSRWTWSFHVQ